MNEHVLEAIVKLLAIIASADGITDKERLLIKRFLTIRLNDAAVEPYLQLFDSYRKDPSEAAQAVENMCVQINQELSLRQKVIILVHVIELVIADHKLSEAESQLILKTCSCLRIEEQLFYNIQQFLTATDLYQLQQPDLLIIDSKEKNAALKAHHLQHTDLRSTLGVLRLPSLDLYLLRILNQKEDLFLNGELLLEHQAYMFTHGSVIRGEHVEPVYYSEVVSKFMRAAVPEPISFHAQNISYWFSNGRQGLHDINLAEESGRLVALMGASGSGKSTLLSVLNGTLKPQKGEVLINGINIHTNPEEIEGVIGYVPQDDLLIEDLTVYQNLYYAARLCFGTATEEQLVDLAEQTLARLGLTETRDLKVGNPLEKTISGGQRKRLNIGLELLREPSVLFIDEPTSGLSSRDSENILDLLRELTLQGKVVFVVIHQPSSDLFKMFDRLLILDTGGYPIYYGNPVEAVVYFKTLASQTNREHGECIECGNVNPEQIFNIIEGRVVDEFGQVTNVRKISPQKWNEEYKDKIKLPKPAAVSAKPAHTIHIPTYWQQFKVFVTRDLLAKFHNTQYLAINLLQGPLLAGLLAYITRYYHTDELTEQGIYLFEDNVNIPAYMFMSVIVALFMGLTISAEEIIKDARIRKREAFLHLSRNSYLLSKVVILFMFSAVQMLLYVLVGNYIAGIGGLTSTYWLVLFSTCCFANMLGLNVSDSFNSVITIYILIPILLIPQLLLGGVVVKFDELNPHFSREGKVPIIADLMAARWAFEGLAVAQFKDNDYERDFYAFDKTMANADYKTTIYLPELQNKVKTARHLLETKQTASDDFKNSLRVLKTEIERQQRLTNFPGYKTENLQPEKFDVKTADETANYLDLVKKHYQKQRAEASRQKDDVIYQLTSTPEAREQFRAKIKNFRNERIAQLVTNAGAEKKIIEHEGELIRKVTPIYADHSDTGHFLDYRSHFYAPQKHFAGQYFSTVNFNLAVIWLMSFILYFTLYFRVFRRLLSVQLPGKKVR